MIERGTCNFSEKVYNAQRGGAIATIIYNNAANGDTVATMGNGVHGADVTIPSWEIGRTNGLNTLAWANTNPATAQAKFDPAPSQQPNAGDVMAGFSSRGPTTDKLLKPDVAAPGVNVLSGGYGSGAFPGPFIGFGQVSGTSMATPHVAGSAALLVQLHPNWTPAQIKSALMTTATENVWTNTAKTILAGVLDRGAGRIDLTKAGNPGLTLDQPEPQRRRDHRRPARDFTIQQRTSAAPAERGAFRRSRRGCGDAQLRDHAQHGFADGCGGRHRDARRDRRGGRGRSARRLRGQGRAHERCDDGSRSRLAPCAADDADGGRPAHRRRRLDPRVEHSRTTRRRT